MSHTIVIFGASGDLTSRKLIPALYRLYLRRRLPEPTRIVGVSRTAYGDQQWRAELAESTARFAGDEFDRERFAEFAGTLFYRPGDIGRAGDFQTLGNQLDALEAGQPSTRVYYLATMPSLYATAVAGLGQAGLASQRQGARRIVIEKPFGTDLESARQLNHTVHLAFDERQVFRIDHYLGKETVQNILVLRLANSIFEPIWNRNYIDHVQMTVAEEGVVGQRGAYYDGAGVLRDMFQNHLLQLLTIIAMEAPVSYQADMVRDEKVKVLRSIRPLTPDDVARDTLRAQYDGYRQEPGVAADSRTPTFAAVKLHVDNWRWNGVPFYLRSGKAMSCRTTQIVIQFREPPHLLFNGDAWQALEPNRLVIQIQPAEGIQLHFQTKVPDAGMRLRTSHLDFNFQRQLAGSMPDAYQRLLLDALLGDASLFARSDEVELAWTIIDPILERWQASSTPPIEAYPSGQWGPDASSQWMADQGRSWFDVCV